jgi:putative membrane protein
MSGTEFDRAYINDMVKDHESDVADFQKEADSGANPDLKNWASSTLPNLRDHLRRAKDDQSAMGLTSSK